MRQPEPRSQWMHHTPRGLLTSGTPMTLQQSVQLPHDLPSNGLVGIGILSMSVAKLLCHMSVYE
jgi:hypothetical protein